MVLDSRLLDSRTVQNRVEEVVSANTHWCGLACSTADVQVSNLLHVHDDTNEIIQSKLRLVVVFQLRPCRSHSLSQWRRSKTLATYHILVI